MLSRSMLSGLLSEAASPDARRLLGIAGVLVLAALLWRRVRDGLVGVAVFGTVFVTAWLDDHAQASAPAATAPATPPAAVAPVPTLPPQLVTPASGQRRILRV